MNELYHYGIKGQKWGVRRFQNKDGSLTNAGKRRLVNKMKQDFKDHYDKTELPTYRFYSGDDSKKPYYKQVGTKKDYSGALSKTRQGIREEAESVYNSQDLKKARDKYYDSMKLSKEFYSDSDVVYKFRKQAYENELKELEGENIRFSKDILKANIMSGENGDSEAFSLYIKSKGLDPFEDYSKPVMDAERAYRAEQKKFAKKLLGKYGNKVVAEYEVETGRKVRKDAKEMVEWAMEDIMRSEIYKMKLIDY